MVKDIAYDVLFVLKRQQYSPSFLGLLKLEENSTFHGAVSLAFSSLFIDYSLNGTVLHSLHTHTQKSPTKLKKSGVSI